jgi:hypothetical protein
MKPHIKRKTPKEVYPTDRAFPHKTIMKNDGLVNSPSAALRCNPAPLENLPALGMQG